MKLSTVFTLASATLATSFGGHGLGGGHGYGGSLPKPDDHNVNTGVAAFMENNGIVQSDKCEVRCLPKMCIDEAVIKGSTTTVTYICPETPTPTPTSAVNMEPSTVLVTVTEYTTTTVMPSTSAAMTSQAAPQVPSSASPMPAVTSAADIPAVPSSSSSVEPTTTITRVSTVKTTITIRRSSSVMFSNSTSQVVTGTSVAASLTAVSVTTNLASSNVSATLSSKSHTPWNTSGFQWTNATTKTSGSVGTVTQTTVSGNPYSVPDPIMSLPTASFEHSRTANKTKTFVLTVTPSPRLPHFHSSKLAFPTFEFNGTQGFFPTSPTTPCSTGSAPAPTHGGSAYMWPRDVRRHNGPPEVESWNSTFTDGALAPPAMPTGSGISDVHFPAGTAGTTATMPLAVNATATSSPHTHHMHPTSTETVEQITDDPTTPAAKPTGDAGGLGVSLVALAMGVAAAMFL